MDEESKRFFETLAAESPRGLALVASSFLEEALQELLDTAVQSNLTTKEVDELFNGPQSPAGSFRSRTLLCYALGLIDKNMKNALDHVRKKIRNKCAHRTEPVALTEDAVEALLVMFDPSSKEMVRRCKESEAGRSGVDDLQITFTICATVLWTDIRLKTKYRKNPIKYADALKALASGET